MSLSFSSWICQYKWIKERRFDLSLKAGPLYSRGHLYSMKKSQWNSWEGKTHLFFSVLYSGAQIPCHLDHSAALVKEHGAWQPVQGCSQSCSHCRGRLTAWWAPDNLSFLQCPSDLWQQQMQTGAWRLRDSNTEDLPFLYFKNRRCYWDHKESFRSFI